MISIEHTINNSKLDNKNNRVINMSTMKANTMNHLTVKRDRTDFTNSTEKPKKNLIDLTKEHNSSMNINSKKSKRDNRKK